MAQKKTPKIIQVIVVPATENYHSSFTHALDEDGNLYIEVTGAEGPEWRLYISNNKERQ